MGEEETEYLVEVIEIYEDIEKTDFCFSDEISSIVARVGLFLLITGTVVTTLNPISSEIAAKILLSMVSTGAVLYGGGFLLLLLNIMELHSLKKYKKLLLEDLKKFATSKKYSIALELYEAMTKGDSYKINRIYYDLKDEKGYEL